ncbi:MAG TPA: menaquinone biosynthesis protein, partial [Deltaproteobacteria bacterium]|nr:menaquinone biosynthesis protein [Deltaproteobacteria bacterium]
MNLGYIDYLNCYPFYHHMFEYEPVSGVRIVPGYPSELNRMIQERSLDVSPISAAAYAGLEDELVLIPEFCLSSIGYVRSVVLVSRMPIEDLQGRVIGLSSASKTSVVLLKILLQRFYGIDAVYVPSGTSPSLDREGYDAALIIGNEAMRQLRDPYVYDLGDLWFRKTGYPVVFAVFAIRSEIIETHEKEILEVVASYRRSLDCLRTDRTGLIQKARERYPLVSWDIDAYYRLLQFRFTPGLREGLG